MKEENPLLATWEWLGMNWNLYVEWRNGLHSKVKRIKQLFLAKQNNWIRTAAIFYSFFHFTFILILILFFLLTKKLILFIIVIINIILLLLLSVIQYVTPYPFPQDRFLFFIFFYLPFIYIYTYLVLFYMLKCTFWMMWH